MSRARCILLAASATVSGALALQVRGGTPMEFPHASHTDMSCTECHAVAESDDLRVSVSPDRSVCLDCHEATELAAWGMAEAPAAESGFVDFSHRAHLGPDGDCLGCHGAVLHPEWAADGRGVLSHDACFPCHDGREQTDGCEDCHSGLRDGRLTAGWRDISVLKPLDHHPGFLATHDAAARLDGAECRTCHREEDFCSRCHFGENVDELTHSRNWLQTHPLEARKGLSECQACHRTEEHCTPCHAAAGVKPADHFLGTWMPRGHADAVRRDIVLCASCHEDDEFVCSRCHQTHIEGTR